MRRSLRSSLLTLVLCALARDASAHLISGLLKTAQTTVNSVTCRIPLLSSPKIDAAVQKCARDGGQGTLRVMVSSRQIVWGTTITGTSIDGNHIVWGAAEQSSTTVWGNLADAPSGSP